MANLNKMLTYTRVFVIKVDDIRKNKTPSITIKTAISPVSNPISAIYWLIRFVPQNMHNLPSIKLVSTEDRLLKVAAGFEFVTTTMESQCDIFSQKKFQSPVTFDKEDDFDEYELSLGENDCRFNKEDQVPKLLKIFPGNVFKIVCKLAIEEYNVDEFDEDSVDESHLDLAASNLFFKITEDSDDNFLSDVTLSSSDSVAFKCHRFVLCAKSTVFNTMFSNKNFKESVNTCTVNIDDIDGKTLKEMLRFIYTNDVSEDFGDLIEQVLYGCEKYDLKQLKSVCENALKQRLNAKNIFRYFEIADQYKLESLTTDCCKLFTVYFHLFDKNSVVNFFTQFPYLAYDLCGRLIMNDEDE